MHPVVSNRDKLILKSDLSQGIVSHHGLPVFLELPQLLSSLNDA